MEIFNHGYTINLRRLWPPETLGYTGNRYIATIPELKTKYLWAIGKDPISALENLNTAFERWRSLQAELQPQTAPDPVTVAGQQPPDTGASNCKGSPTPDVSHVLYEVIAKLNHALAILCRQGR